MYYNNYEMRETNDITTKGNEMLNTTTVTIKRTNGIIEIVTVPNAPNQTWLDLVYAKTKAAGAGEIIKMERTTLTSNIPQLVAEYNKLNNEGGEGYIPEVEYFMSLPDFKESTVHVCLTPQQRGTK